MEARASHREPGHSVWKERWSEVEEPGWKAGDKVVWDRSIWMGLWEWEPRVSNFVLQSDAHQRISAAEISLSNQTDRVSRCFLGQLTGK